MTLLWLRLAVLLYGIAALAVLPAALYDRPRWRHVAIPATIAAALFHFVSLTETLDAAHHRLPVNTHEPPSRLGLLLALAFLLVSAGYRSVSLGIFLLPVVCWLSCSPPSVRATKLLRAVAHRLALCTSPCCWPRMQRIFISLIASLLYLIQERRLKQKLSAFAGIPQLSTPLETLDQIALKSLLFGLPCMTAGLLIGSVVALQDHRPDVLR